MAQIELASEFKVPRSSPSKHKSLLTNCSTHSLKQRRQLFRSTDPTFSFKLAATREERHVLPDGMQLEVLSQLPEHKAEQKKPPLLFLHGSAHGAWCWKENFLPYFSEFGYRSYALSLRGQGESDGRDLKYSGTLESHAEDVMDFVKTLDAKPVIVGHSFAGLFVQYMSMGEMKDAFVGFATLCSTPPSGNGKMIRRFMKDDFLKSLKVSWHILARTFKENVGTAKFLFFSDDIPSDLLERYQTQLAACSPVVIIDPLRLNKSLPLAQPDNSIAAFVLGAQNDNLVDATAVEETAEWYGVEPIILPNMAHDVMLDTRWEQAASSLRMWLDSST